MDWLTLVLIFPVGIIIILHFLSQKFGRFEKSGILHIKPLPIFGNMAAVLFRQCSFVDIIEKVYKLNDEAKYVGFYNLGEPVIVIRSPELIKDIAVKSFDHFVDHRGFVDADQDILFGSNLFSLRGEKWRDMRTLLTPAFTSSKIKGMFKVMSNCGRDFANFFAERSINEPCTIDGKDVFTRYTSDVIGHCAFGIDVDSLRNPNNDFYTLGRKATDIEGILALKFFCLQNFPRIAKLFNIKLVQEKVRTFFEGIVRETVEMRECKGISRPDMIQLMMDSRDKKSGDVPELTIVGMTAHAFSFFFGGFESSSSLMCFVAYQIAMSKDTQQKLQDEVDAVTRDTNGEVTYEALNGMKYLDAVINETMRLYPTGPILDRICVKAYKLPPAFPGAEPITLEPDQSVWFPVSAIQRDPKYFRDPDNFEPERFIGDAKNDIDPFTFLPFGHGPRMCIGNRFALLQSKIVIFHLLAKYNLKLSAKMRVPLELSKASFHLAAKDGFWFELESREKTS